MTLGQIRLSQTMIVKNEERNIKSALSWGKDIAFEQIVVDTGSTDGTVKEALNMGARVIYFKWVDDFSAAKNFALEQCKGEWIAILDADEYFLPEDAKKIISVIQKAEEAGASAINTSLTSIDGKGGIINKTTQVRLIKNIKGLRYKRRIHETLTYPGELKVYDAEELNIIHTGYIEEIAKEKQASGRNRKLLLEELREDPFNSELLGYLGDDYAIDETEREEAIKTYYKAIDNLPEEINRHDTRTADTFTKLIVLLGLKDREEEIRKIYEKAITCLPENADFSYYTGLFFYKKEDYESAFKYYAEAFDKFDKYPGEGNSENLRSCLIEAYAQYGDILLEHNDAKSAVSIESSVLKQDKKEYTALKTILKAFFRNNVSAPMVMDYLSKIYDFNESLDKLLLHRAAGETGFTELTKLIKEKMNSRELELL